MVDVQVVTCASHFNIVRGAGLSASKAAPFIALQLSFQLVYEAKLIYTLRIF